MTEAQIADLLKTLHVISGHMIAIAWALWLMLVFK